MGVRSGRVAEVLVRSRPQQSATGGAACDIRIAVAGNVDSGKSTLIGVFTGTGKLDNGNGGARSQVFTHQVLNAPPFCASARNSSDGFWLLRSKLC